MLWAAAAPCFFGFLHSGAGVPSGGGCEIANTYPVTEHLSGC